MLGASPVAAQDTAEERGPLRTRIGIGPALYPSYPGADDHQVSPLVEFERTRGEQFDFEAADDSFGFNLIDTGSFSIGPVANWEGKRKAEDVGADVPEIDFTIELGAAAALYLTDNLRLRAEVRRGVTGHEGLIATGGADLVMRDGDQWLFAVGPRVTWTDEEYQNTWFGVTPGAALTSGLPGYAPEGGVQAVGATATFLTQFTPQWGIYSFVKYDRLVGDPADSPLVTQLGSQDQFAGGVALTYTFGSGVR